ncbi:MAG: YlmH/Sll1252 family protein, partial [Turicibacter sp.]
NSDIKVEFEGGFLQAERQRAIISSLSSEYDINLTTVVGLNVSYPKRHITLEHRQLLGSLTALKIDRSWIGDILIQDDGTILIAVCEEYSSFIYGNFNKVGKNPITLSQVSIAQVKRIESFEEFEIIIASLRLDVVVAAITKQSRQVVHELVTQGAVQMNWKMEQNHSKICGLTDVVSIRKYGRFKLLSQKAVTKSGKIIVIVGKTI